MLAASESSLRGGQEEGAAKEEGTSTPRKTSSESSSGHKGPSECEMEDSVFSSDKEGEAAVCGWLAGELHCKASGSGWTSGCNRGKSCLFHFRCTLDATGGRAVFFACTVHWLQQVEELSFSLPLYTRCNRRNGCLFHFHSTDSSVPVLRLCVYCDCCAC